MFEYGNETWRNFSVGDIVKVRDDLKIGTIYSSYPFFGDIFTSSMYKYSGMSGKVLKCTAKGYSLDIAPMFTFTEGMLTVCDDNDIINYGKYWKENIINSNVYRNNKKKVLFLRNKINNLIENGESEKYPDEFEKLVDEYIKLSQLIDRYKK